MTDFDHNAIDEVLQSRVRIAIVAFLASAGNVDFAGIRDAIKTSDGNTSVHLRKLEDAGYIAAKKRFVARKPQSLEHHLHAGILHHRQQHVGVWVLGMIGINEAVQIGIR